MALVTQDLPSEPLRILGNMSGNRLLQAGCKKRSRPGTALRSRQVVEALEALSSLLSGIADAVRVVGGEPYLIPAMGSHGGATAEGQTEILRDWGVLATGSGADIHATMETVFFERRPNGAVAHMDSHAANADGIIVLGRTKTHPESAGRTRVRAAENVYGRSWQTGGAQQAHSHGLWDSVRQVPKLQLAKSKVLFGVAMVENGYRQPVVIEVVPGNYEAFLEADIRLLRIAKTHLAKLPFDELDLLVVDELGKNISGAGWIRTSLAIAKRTQLHLRITRDWLCFRSPILL